MRKRIFTAILIIEIVIVIGNRTFWKTVKSLLSEKVTKHSKINLVEDDKINSRDDQIAKKFSKFFISIPLKSSVNSL